MEDNHLKDLADKARKAIIESVAILAKSEQKDGRIFKEEGRDIKLEADLLLHAELTFRLIDTTQIPCMSEEDISTHGLDDDTLFWIVDPLDGSMNYSLGLPLYCISIALWNKGTPFLGLIHDIERKQTFVGYDNTAQVNGMRLTMGEKRELEKAVLATGIPVLADTSSESMRWFLTFTNHFKKIRMLGTAALSLAWVAQGRIDAYFEKDIMLWDVAAGAALIRAAGGTCIIHPGTHPLSRIVLAANPIIATQMQKVLE